MFPRAVLLNITYAQTMHCCKPCSDSIYTYWLWKTQWFLQKLIKRCYVVTVLDLQTTTCTYMCLFCWVFCDRGSTIRCRHYVICLNDTHVRFAREVWLHNMFLWKIIHVRMPWKILSKNIPVPFSFTDFSFLYFYLQTYYFDV